MRATTTLSGEIARVTDKAVMFRPENGDEEFWIPRSVCVDGEELDEGDTDLIVENWWLRKEGRL